MGAYQKFDLAWAASVLDWWQEAGVDLIVDDQPHDWLAAPAEPEAPATATPIAPAPTAAASAPAPLAAIPEDLTAFLEWRHGADAPEARWHGVSIAATGPRDAAVMVLVDCPDRDDGEAGVLMTGEVGRLFDRMLAAIGLSRETVHLASVCARRPLAGRMPREVEARLGELASAHTALIAPKRLLLLGNAASRAILGTELAQARGSLRAFNHKGTQVEVVASFHPRFLIEKPAAKAEAWKDLQLLMGGMSA